MISTLLLLLTWWALSVQLSRWQSKLRDLLLPLTFVLAMAGLASLFVACLATLPGPSHYRLALLLLSTLCIILIMAQPKESVNSLRSLGRFLTLSEQASALNGGKTGLPREAKLLGLLRKTLLLASLAILTARTLLDGAPGNWDSHTYNVARGVAMIAQGSPFLSSSGSLRQVIYPLGHDLIFFPDLVFGNLWGLGLISTTEYIILLGALLQLTRHLCDQLPVLRDPRRATYAWATLLTLCLAIGCDQQAMQAVTTKNDLIIVTLFAIAALWSCHIVNAVNVSWSEVICIPLLLTSYAVFSKSYGVVVLYPPILALFGRMCQGLQWGRRRNPWPLTLHLAFLGPSLAIVATELTHRHFIAQLDANLSPITTAWTNSHGPLIMRLQIWIVNCLRILVSLLSYPYSTWLKANPRSDDDYIFSVRALGSLLENRFGIASQASGFQLVRIASEDKGYLSILTQLLLAAALVYALSRIVPRISKTLLPLRQSGRLVSKYGSVFILLGGSLLAFATISYAVLYQTWISRFLGTAYILLVPLAAVCLAHLLCRNWPGCSGRPSRLAASGGTVFLAAGLWTASLLNLAHRVLPSEYRKLLVQSLSDPGSFRRGRQAMDLYRGYLAHSGFTATEQETFLRSLASEPFDHRTLCYGEDTPSLIPLLTTVANPSFQPGRVTMADGNDCPRTSSAAGKPGMVAKPGRGFFEKGGSQYVILP